MGAFYFNEAALTGSPPEGRKRKRERKYIWTESHIPSSSYFYWNVPACFFHQKIGEDHDQKDHPTALLLSTRVKIYVTCRLFKFLLFSTCPQPHSHKSNFFRPTIVSILKKIREEEEEDGRGRCLLKRLVWYISLIKT